MNTMLININNKIIRNKYRIVRVCVYFGVIFISYISFMNLIMTSDYIPAADSQGMIAQPKISDYISGGRFATYFILWIYYFLSKLGITHYTKTFVLQLMGMIIYTISAYITYSLLEKNKNRKLGFLDSGILFAYINPMMVETYVYGAFDFALGIFFAIIGAQKFVKQKYIQSFIFAFIAVSIYQSNILIMLIVCLSAIFILYNENKKKLFLNLIFSGMLCVLAAFSNIGIQKLLLSTNNYGEAVKNATVVSDLSEHIHNIIITMINILDNFYGMYPRYLLPMLILSTCIIGIAAFGIQGKVFNCIVWIVLCGVLTVIPFSFGIVTAELWYPQRTMLSLMFSVSMMVTMLLVISNAKKYINYIFIPVASIFLFVNYFFTCNCIIDCFIGQAVDKNEAMCVQKEIEKYEQETNNKIEMIVSRVDLNPKYTYENVQLLSYNYATYNHRVMRDAWAQGGYLNYVNHTNYQYREMSNEEYSEYFDNKQWDYYMPSEQLVFVDNILYWAVY